MNALSVSVDERQRKRSALLRQGAGRVRESRVEDHFAEHQLADDPLELLRVAAHRPWRR